MDTKLPTGIVTFLFTDVVGSTRLLVDLGAEVYAEALAAHRVIVRDALRRHDGVEVDTQGDAFFAAFADAGEAVRSAAAICTDLESTPIRVRIGLHTGTALVSGGGYVGTDVHLGARIAAAAHSGQIVFSQETARLLDAEFTVRDLGEHRLKDFPRPVAIRQLGDAPFPPLTTIANTNLPTPVSTFVGRETEVVAVAALARDGARLITLTGPGGTGKTRLAVEAARRLLDSFGAGVWWVNLTSAVDPAVVLPSVATVLGTTEELSAHIADRAMLLVLDNLEQVVSVAPRLMDLLTTCPRLVLIVTSRITLGLSGEREVRVAPLSPDEGVVLFTERSGLDASPQVRELCERLDHLPLAVELAAARARLLGVGAVLERLGARLDVLKGGRDLDARRETLRATIAWSDSLLSDDARRVFRRLSLFVGGWTIDSAQAVLGADADLDALALLVDHSLVQAAGGRFWMLETIRVYATEGLATEQDRQAVQDAFWRWALALIQREDSRLRTTEQLDALERLDLETANLRTAFAFAVASGVPDAARSFAHAARWFLSRRGLQAEANEWTHTALECPGEDDALLGWTLLDAATSTYGGTTSAESMAVMERARDLGARAGDQRLVATVLEKQGYVDPSPRGIASMEQAAAIYERLGLRDEQARIALNRAARALNDGDDEAAITAADVGIRLVTALGNQHGLGVGLGTRAAALALTGDAERSRAALAAAAAAFESIDEQFGRVILLEVAALVDVRTGSTDRLTALVRAAIDTGYAVAGEEWEPSDARILRLVDDALLDLDSDILSAATLEGRASDPRTALEQWLRARDLMPRSE